MFETAEIGREIPKDEYADGLEALRVDLLSAQKAVSDAKLPVVVLINGVDGGGKGEFLNTLYEWMDARYLTTQAYSAPTDEEMQRPEFWRFWMWLPPRGRIGVFLGSWYTEPILHHTYGKIDAAAFESRLDRINDFERALCFDGALIVKFWLHISKREQKRRFKTLEKEKATRWRVSKRDWEHHALYDSFVGVCSKAIRTTSTGHAPWQVIESTDWRYRNATAARYLVSSIRQRLEQSNRPPPVAPAPVQQDPLTILDTLHLEKSLSREQYEDQLARYQGRLNRLSRRLLPSARGAILVFEGMDAAGKGGAIRRVIRALDARQYRVIPIAAPNEEERAHHYLWRFWRHIPRRGRFTIYDRSWYGRVLVERVEGFAREEEWRRAYKEINDFEQQLIESGNVVMKFWMQISADEQMRRFEEREKSPYKQFKITEEDYRNRAKANDYELAASEMLERTSTEYSPWCLIEANDKRYARVKVLKTICDRLKNALE